MSAVDFLDQARTVAATQADDSEANWHLKERLEEFLRDCRYGWASSRSTLMLSISASYSALYFATEMVFGRQIRPFS